MPLQRMQGDQGDTDAGGVPMDPRIKSDLAESYGIAVRHAEPVTGGWLNRKWKVDDGAGTYLVKQFSHSRYDRTKLEQIRHALRRQQTLETEVFPCPHIVPCRGEVVRRLDGETTYMVMTFCAGAMERHDTISTEQMHSLGSTCGAMHAAFSRLPVQGVFGHPLNGTDTLASLWGYHRAQADGMTPDAPPLFRQAVGAQPAILATISPAWLDGLPAGIAHEDFSPDNMLFHPHGVSAILDFDRNRFNWLWHDIGRALLSFAWTGTRLDTGKVAAFRTGYAEYRPLSQADVVDALRITWCVESPWWIVPEGFAEGRSEKVTRFRDELLWLTRRWFELETLL